MSALRRSELSKDVRHLVCNDIFRRLDFGGAVPVAEPFKQKKGLLLEKQSFERFLCQSANKR
ncbi:hypothetical protein BKI51_14715 [Alphaproteobacteria bacterium AO1-B]|nr:hypothetical protein BKI51_14715 [Alphaproteobacteria bacterium AO1-B]